MADHFNAGWHEFAAPWTSRDVVYALDGRPIAAMTLLRPIKGSAQVRFALARGTAKLHTPPDLQIADLEIGLTHDQP